MDPEPKTEPTGPQGRSLFDSLSLPSSSGLPVEFEGSKISGPGSPTAFQEETSRRSGRPIKRKKFDDEIVVGHACFSLSQSNSLDRVFF